MKSLFILTSDNGDGSTSVHFTFNEDFIQSLQVRYNNDELEYGDLGVDGDGFSYKALNVPDECTLETLGIHYDVAED